MANLYGRMSDLNKRLQRKNVALQMRLREIERANIELALEPWLMPAPRGASKMGARIQPSRERAAGPHYPAGIVPHASSRRALDAHAKGASNFTLHSILFAPGLSPRPLSGGGASACVRRQQAAVFCSH